jgi:hypothetical protein
MPSAGQVTIHDRQRTQPGCILYSPYAGEGFVLIDRDGEIVHWWDTGGYVKLGELLPDGRLLFARMRIGVFEADWDGNILWRFACRQHHDFCRKPNGNTLAVAHELKFNARVWHGAIDKNDVLIEADRDGNVLWKVALDEQAEDLLRLTGLEFPRRQEDWAHTNTVESLPETALGRRDERFRPGNVLFSSRNMHTIGVIDYATRKVVWAFGGGELDGQHMPTMLSDGRLLVFDNGTSRGFSRVIELDPERDEITWEFRLPDYAFARALSGQEVLPNGNILVCCGTPGILMEVTRDGEIVWELRNGVEGCRAEYRTAVYRAALCPAGVVEPRL